MRHRPPLKLYKYKQSEKINPINALRSLPKPARQVTKKENNKDIEWTQTKNPLAVG